MGADVAGALEFLCALDEIGLLHWQFEVGGRLCWDLVGIVGPVRTAHAAGGNGEGIVKVLHGFAETFSECFVLTELGELVIGVQERHGSFW